MEREREPSVTVLKIRKKRDVYIIEKIDYDRHWFGLVTYLTWCMPRIISSKKPKVFVFLLNDCSSFNWNTTFTLAIKWIIGMITEGKEKWTWNWESAEWRKLHFFNLLYNNYYTYSLYNRLTYLFVITLALILCFVSFKVS